MNTERFSPPLDQLLTLGQPEDSITWADEPQLGLGSEYIPDLIRMASDPELLEADADSQEVWAPVHAWRALGQLEAVDAIQPLLALWDDQEYNDWLHEDMPEVFVRIGPVAIPALREYLVDKSHRLRPRVTAALCLLEMGLEYPESRLECIAALTQALEQYEDNDEGLNGEIIDALVELEAVEAAPLIERVFAADRVDDMISGDWEDVQVRLGLKAAPEMSADLSEFDFTPETSQSAATSGHLPASSPHQAKPKKSGDRQAKAKRKQAEKSRKQNRKKKK